jgi:hypothetical protein
VEVGADAGAFIETVTSISRIEQAVNQTVCAARGQGLHDHPYFHAPGGSMEVLEFLSTPVMAAWLHCSRGGLSTEPS